MKRCIICALIVLMMDCSEPSNHSLKESLTFDKTIDLLVPKESIFDPYDLILIHDPVELLGNGRNFYAIINYPNGVFFRDKSLIFFCGRLMEITYLLYMI